MTPCPGGKKDLFGTSGVRVPLFAVSEAFRFPAANSSAKAYPSKPWVLRTSTQRHSPPLRRRFARTLLSWRMRRTAIAPPSASRPTDSSRPSTGRRTGAIRTRFQKARQLRPIVRFVLQGSTSAEVEGTLRLERSKSRRMSFISMAKRRHNRRLQRIRCRVSACRTRSNLHQWSRSLPR
jgi:hypothetical protein